MEKGLVSIITPCYNGEKFLDRYFNSILNQTYNNIELIFVDDGSTDNTKMIAEKYKKKLISKGLKYTYICMHSNVGQAGAINKGLPLVHGEFLVWPDSDDFYEKNAIEEMVKYLKNNLNKDYVRCKVIIRNENDLENIIKISGPKQKNKENLFEDYLFCNDIYCFSGVIMIRMAYFDKVKKERKIYETRYGQNWQLILPVALKGKAGFIDEALYNYVIRENSHSHKKLYDIASEIKKMDEHYKILYNVLSEIGVYDQYKIRLDDIYAKKKMLISLKYLDNKRAKAYANQIKDKKKFSKSEKIKYMISNNSVLFELYKYARLLKNKIKG